MRIPLPLFASILLLVSACSELPQPEEKIDAAPVLLAALACPETVTWTMTSVCGSDKSDAETKAVNATKPNYSCADPCVLNVVGTAGAAGGRCALQRNPPKFGVKYDVDLLITCR